MVVISPFSPTGAAATQPASTDVRALAAARAAPATANGVLVVDLDALARNYAKLRALAAPAECGAAIKAEAYGLGADEVARTLFDAGCRTFFIASQAEGAALRATLPDATIYALNGLPPGTAADFARADVRPVLGSMREIDEWKAYCRAQNDARPAAIQIDTGMNRLGIKAADCETLRELPPEPETSAAALAPAFPVSLVMSHLACADEADHPKNAAQLKAFVALSALIPPATRSLANSAGTFLGTAYHFDLVRPGIALYGGNPFTGKPNPMEPVVRLYGRVAHVGEAESGETVGYGASRHLLRHTRYVTVTAGYADGLFRAAGSRDGHEGIFATAGEHRLPILGRVSMDLSVFDATDTPENTIRPGDFVGLLGARFTADDVALRAGTISYEVLTNLGRRYHRIYIGTKNRD